MTIRELAAVLAKHIEAGASDVEVFVTWEATIHQLDDDEVYLSADGDLVIDGDANVYKDRITSEKGWTRPNEGPE